jgi:NADPH2:quinone reductase
MRAIQIQASGGPEVLTFADVAAPALKREADVLVRVRAAGINPVDTKMRAKAELYGLRLPAVLGCDGAGVIEAVGADVNDLKPGDEVYYSRPPFGTVPGNYAEYAVVDSRLVAKKPKTMSFEQAAAAPLVLITAWEALHDRARIRPGQTVLVHAGAGGVGHVAIQVARLAGATVAATVGSDEKAAFVESLGADNAIYYKDENFADEVMNWTDGEGADIVLDTVGGKTFEQSFLAARFYGDVVTLLAPPADTNWGLARNRNLRVSFELMLTPVFANLDYALEHQGEILRRCAELIDAGKLRVHVHETLPLARAADAHRLLESGKVLGKVVLALG